MGTHLKLDSANRTNFHIPFSLTAAIDKQPQTAIYRLWNEFPHQQIKLICERFEFPNFKMFLYILYMSPMSSTPRLML